MKRALTAAMLFVCLVPSLTTVAAQDSIVRRYHPRYKFIDLGTLGGPHSYGPVNGAGRLLNNSGVVSSFADTTAEHPDAPDFCGAPECLVFHAFRWSHGVMRDLGGVDDRYNSAAASINDRGWSTGQSETGEFDPAFNFPLFHTVLWKGRTKVDIGTLPGGNTSIGFSINNAGQVVAFGNNDVPDPFALAFPSATQMRTFLWQDGQVQDIGTLGGPDAIPGTGCDNQRPGIIVGASYTGFAPNTASGIPTLDAFLWDNGTMTDLGNLGGTSSGAQCINNRGQVIGFSTLAGDVVTHAFLWQRGKMQDLGTLGGPLSEAQWINESGEIAGSADLPTPNLHDAVVWKNGRIHDLGTVPGDPCSRAYAINSRGQVVGGSSSCLAFLHAFVWQEHGTLMDLNTLIQPGTGYQLTNAININDRGEILAVAAPVGFPPDEAELGHLALLIPCDNDHANIHGCDYSEVDNDSVAAGVNTVPLPVIRNSWNEDTPAFLGVSKEMLKRRVLVHR